jgi:CBS domain-containing protein
MATDVVTVRADDTVRTAAEKLLNHHISGAPVLDSGDRLVGMLSEGDLIRRAEIGTEKRRSWWLELVSAPETKAQDFVRAHALKVADVMTPNVVTAAPETSLEELATLLERHGIKRVPIVRDAQVLGIVSRANLLRAFARAAARPTVPAIADDRAIREQVINQIRSLPWGMPWLLTVTVQDGIVELWGPVSSNDKRRALRVAAEATPGVKAVHDRFYTIPASAD